MEGGGFQRLDWSEVILELFTIFLFRRMLEPAVLGDADDHTLTKGWPLNGHQHTRMQRTRYIQTFESSSRDQQLGNEINREE